MNQSKNLKVLIAEDNAINQLLYKHIFSKCSIEYTIVDNGLELLNLVRKNIYFDMILMDIRMPVMNGIQAATCIREEFSDYQIPILAITADDILIDQLPDDSELFDDVLLKPFTTNQLIHKMYINCTRFSLSRQFILNYG